MARSSGLGKGLASLIPSDISEEISESALRHIDVSHAYPNRFQPRAHFNEETLIALADSIAAVGMIQPIIVRETDQGYEILAGERRWRAAQRTGLKQIPALIRNSDDLNSLEVSIIENIQRDDLNALEEAAAYRQLTDEFELTQEQVANKVGRSRSAVANAIRLLSLPVATQRMIVDGCLSAGHGRAILTVKGDKNRQKIAKEILKHNLSVRETEKLAASINNAEDRSDSTKQKQISEEHEEAQTGVLELEELLTTRLNAEVNVRIVRGAQSRGQGKIVIKFEDLTDLERIYNSIAS